MIKIYKLFFKILIILFIVSIYSCQPNTCGNGIQDGDETGIDCGGLNCPDCPSQCIGTNMFIGNVILSSQTAIDSFGAFNYKEIVGNLQIGKGIFNYNTPELTDESDINDLASLCSLNKINGSLYIKNNPNLINLNGLNNIDTITNQILIVGNSFIDVDEFANIDFVKNIFISNNEITDLNGFNTLSSLNNLEFLCINYEDLYGLNGITNIDSNLILGPNCGSTNGDSLSYNFLTNLNTIGNKLLISYLQYNKMEQIGNISSVGSLFLSSTSLENLNCFSNLTNINNEINIEGNINLNNYCGLQYLLTNFNGVYNNIGNNLYNPTLLDLQNGDCTP